MRSRRGLSQALRVFRDWLGEAARWRAERGARQTQRRRAEAQDWRGRKFKVFRTGYTNFSGNGGCECVIGNFNTIEMLAFVDVLGMEAGVLLFRAEDVKGKCLPVSICFGGQVVHVRTTESASALVPLSASLLDRN